MLDVQTCMHMDTRTHRIKFLLVGLHPQVTDRAILEEILQMVLEIINSTLSHSLHNNPHLVYSLLYQREVFEPYRTHPSLMDLIQNIETVSF